MIMGKLLLLVLAFFLHACDASTNTKTGDILDSKAKATPEVQAMVEAFRAQAHRIELNGCEMLYNGKPFRLGMTVRELVDILGAYDFFNRGYYVWKVLGIVAVRDVDIAEDVNTEITGFVIYMDDDRIKAYVEDGDIERMKHVVATKEDYFLVQGVPLAKGTPFNDFVARSTYTLNDFYVDNYSYELPFRCKGKKEELIYYIDAKGGWIYKGSGHLMMKSHPDPENTSKILSIEIFYSDE